MALIAEAYARWREQADEDEARARLAAFCVCQRERRHAAALAELPDDARLAGETVLFVLDRLGADLGRDLTLVLDGLSFLSATGAYVPHLGIGIGNHEIDRIDDYGASLPQALAVALALQALLLAFEPEHAAPLVGD